MNLNDENIKIDVLKEDDFSDQTTEPEEKTEREQIKTTIMLAQAVVKAVQAGDLEKAKDLHSQMIGSMPQKLYKDEPDMRQMMKWARAANKMLMSKSESIVLDLGKYQKLNEFSVLSMFGGWVEMILGRMFGDSSIPVTIKGPKRSVEEFGKTLGAEKRYIEALKKYGLDDPKSIRSKSQLDKAIAGFERETGIRWPVGD